MSNSDDLKNIDLFLNGDKNSFSGIIKKYQDMVFRYVYSQFNNYDDALDITQEIFIMTMNALPTFRGESKFSTWLYSIMVNFCKNYRKKNSRLNVMSLNTKIGDNEYEIPLPDKRENPEDKVIAKDSAEIVKEEIDKLPADYREILFLRLIDDLSYNEIADILKISLANVKVRIHRGREMLKNRVQSRGLFK